MKFSKKSATRFGFAILAVFILLNVVAYFHAYKFTHFTDEKVAKTKDAKLLSYPDKLKALFLGIDNPRPVTTILPSQEFETIKLQSNKVIECWLVKTTASKGTVILFHGFSAQKSLMLDKADEFLKLGYNAFLVDFMGSGGSEGNQTTIGFKEAEEVKTSFDYLLASGEKSIFLFGTSMGAVAILKAINDYHLKPAGIIIECPFGSMYQTTCARFKSMGAPVFPMAGLLVFWGGVQNEFPAFSHTPTAYSKKVICPTLLLYGNKDERVSREEIFEIYTNLKGKKQLRVYAQAGHENYLKKYKTEWIRDVAFFLRQHNPIIITR